MTVVADPEAVAFIADHGGCLYVYADSAGLKHVKTVAPGDPSVQFEQIQAEGFVMFVETDIVQPETWNVKFHRYPYHHVDVLWDGHQPGPAQRLDPMRWPN